MLSNLTTRSFFEEPGSHLILWGNFFFQIFCWMYHSIRFIIGLTKNMLFILLKYEKFKSSGPPKFKRIFFFKYLYLLTLFSKNKENYFFELPKTSLIHLIWSINKKLFNYKVFIFLTTNKIYFDLNIPKWAIYRPYFWLNFFSKT